MKLKKYIKIWFYLTLISFAAIIIGAILVGISFGLGHHGASMIPAIFGYISFAVAFGVFVARFVYYIFCIIESRNLKNNDNTVFILLIIGLFVPIVGIVGIIFAWTTVRDLKETENHNQNTIL
ncbi:hypothetical protein H9M94_00650 [Mycoplasma sp. Pen4]|uniref:hypothetical protein n=1 Tax=Mycoplasma sp. Pen4 TaxID=640330 RepID=UPI0016549C9B|nr:hypothetical protein [Mycoplasma sp. Pen4]QNM93773.1 hypothetical protein H9M94_00650 [Mycoplasma sp. Pen4]